jgi:hypothetical protein
MPDRTTFDYEGPSVEPRMQAALNAALAEEEDTITFVAQYVLFFTITWFLLQFTLIRQSKRNQLHCGFC